MKKAFAWIISLGLTLLVSVLIYFSVPDWKKVWEVMLNGNPLFLLIGLIFTMIHMALRAWRWGILLVPIKNQISYNRLFSFTLIKYVINLIPPRAGEIVASVLLAKKEKISSLSVIGTSFLERVLDMITLIIIFGSCLLLFSQIHVSNSDRSQEILFAIKWSFFGFLAFLSALGLLTFLLRQKSWPKIIPSKLKHFFLSFLEGFKIVKRGGNLLKASILSLAIWSCIAFRDWFVVMAYLDDFPLWGAFLIVVITVVGVAIPTPGGMGGFQLFMSLTLVNFFPQNLSSQDPQSQAHAISNVAYICSMAPIILVGLVLLNREGFSWKQISAISQSRAEPIEGSPHRKIKL